MTRIRRDLRATSSAAAAEGRRLPISTRRGRRAQPVLLFAVYLVLLVWLVVWKLQVPYVGEVRSPVKVVPFLAAGGAGASTSGEVVANVLLFVPLGFYLALLRPTSPRWNAVLTIVGASLALETAQWVLAVGSADTSDVIANTAGGLAGVSLLAHGRRRWSGRAVDLMTWAATIGTVVAVIAVGVFVTSPVRFRAPRDGGPPDCRSRACPLTPGDH